MILGLLFLEPWNWWSKETLHWRDTSYRCKSWILFCTKTKFGACYIFGGCWNGRVWCNRWWEKILCWTENNSWGNLMPTFVFYSLPHLSHSALNYIILLNRTSVCMWFVFFIHFLSIFVLLYRLSGFHLHMLSFWIFVSSLCILQLLPSF